ncbi:UbiH/UbiF/VisC/COQ6 family ubiquinone biosynthesis hydroxylase [Cobetia marina]|uniref:UbiH/UbiF/VisC/COQ6 family ubiquinone biosynthesis hydroxylase n=1 Tax=Cobetia marina TaxID=28258 RepID=UPI0026E48998|nr:UbiH/UbiF/VisC/COQ6 family ubiquinone biosynthesis hydroxylase [Cobetia marina]MDO6787442.1 UbiH/UbiF/VisC/COQ6 family ubiquinone biosynthesis hydroxylase [Cobetia marina]
MNEHRRLDAPHEVDVAIVGAGIVGATLALLLGQGGLRVLLIEGREGIVDWQPALAPEPRVSALTPVSRQLLSGLGVWKDIAQSRLMPYTGMQVWDAEGNGEIGFSAEQSGVSELGHIVENRVTQAALEQAISRCPSITRRYGVRVSGLGLPRTGSASVVSAYQLEGAEAASLILSDGSSVAAGLVVAADGARSRLRELAGIETREHDTGQVALVTTVRTAHSHQGVARQRFLPTGPLAFLPLAVNSALAHPESEASGAQCHCSIVWSTTPQEAERLLALPETDFCHELEAAFEGKLGTVEYSAERFSFPLHQRHAQEYVLPGLALVGDAAHAIHPLAGQGVNLGLMDVAVLAEELLDGHRRGVALGDERWLKRYRRRRRSDNAVMLKMMDGFRLLFGSRKPGVRLVRNLGLGWVDGSVELKRLLMRQAMGERGELPESCRPR